MKSRILLSLSLVAGATLGYAEPQFLSKQYARCTTCHYSPTGGALLTPYGRSLSNQELSTFSAATASREHEALFGVLGDRLGALQIGLNFRPAHLEVDFTGGEIERTFVMNADIAAAYQKGRWMFYAEFGRQGRTTGEDWDSFEHWIAYQSEKGFGARVGRFLPAYGVRIADHTTFTRRAYGFDMHDQVYALELSHTSAKRLFQFSIGPGRAQSLIDDDGTARMTLTGRAQFDLTPTTSLVLSGLHRADADRAPKESAGGIGFGFAPTKRWSIWTEGQARSVEGLDGTSYTVMNETSFEAVKGLWLKFTPQLRTAPGDSSAGIERLGLAIDWFVRTHWNLGALYYWDKDRTSDAVSKTFLMQLQFYM
jgi:hypothetical protein